MSRARTRPRPLGNDQSVGGYRETDLRPKSTSIIKASTRLVAGIHTGIAIGSPYRIGLTNAGNPQAKPGPAKGCPARTAPVLAGVVRGGGQRPDRNRQTETAIACPQRDFIA